MKDWKLNNTTKLFIFQTIGDLVAQNHLNVPLVVFDVFYVMSLIAFINFKWSCLISSTVSRDQLEPTCNCVMQGWTVACRKEFKCVVCKCSILFLRSLKRMLFSGKRSWTASMTCLMCGLMSSVDGCTWMASLVEVPTLRLCYQWKLNGSRGEFYGFLALDFISFIHGNGCLLEWKLAKETFAIKGFLVTWID